jgi:hypothetical protein
VSLKQYTHCYDGAYESSGRFYTHASTRFQEGPYSNIEGARAVDGYHSVSAKRVDLLGYFGKESGNAGYSYRKSNFKDEGRHAPPLLLGRLSASLKTEKESVVKLKRD